MKGSILNEARRQLEARLPIRDLLLYVTSARTLLDVVHETSHFSMHVAGQMRDWQDPEAEPGKSSSVELMSSAAEREIESGFPLLHANALMGIWGALEACVHDLCLLYIQCIERKKLAEALSGVKAKVGDYLSLDDADQWEWLLNQIEVAGSGSLRAGVGQFDPTLEALGVKPQIDSNVRTVLYRTKLLRNLYAHRAGVADARFLRDWPEQPVPHGKLVVPTGAQVIAGWVASVFYAETVVNCMARELGSNSQSDPAFPAGITSTDELMSMFTPNPSYPSGAPWSHHISTRE